VQNAATRPDGRTLLAFSIVVVLLGVNFVAIRFSNAELRPFWGSAVRFAAASAILFALAAARRVPLPRGAALQSAVLYGALGFGVAYALVYWGILAVPSGVTSVVFASIPLTTFVMTLALRMEAYRVQGFLGAALALAGIAVISYEQVAGGIAVLPVAAVIVSSVAAAASIIIVKRAPKSHPLSTNAVAMAVGAAILFATSLAAGEPRATPGLIATWVALAWLVTSSVVAFALYIWILKRWTASAASYQTVLSPLVTITVALALVGEPVTGALAGGTALVLAGLYVGSIWKPTQQPA